MASNRSLVAVAAFSSLALNGLTFTFIGASLPMIQVDLSMSIAGAGILMAFLQCGFTLFSLIAGVLSDCVRSEQILLSGCLLLGGGSLFFGMHPSFVVNLAVEQYSIFIMFSLVAKLDSSLSLEWKYLVSSRSSCIEWHDDFWGVSDIFSSLRDSLSQSEGGSAWDINRHGRAWFHGPLLGNWLYCGVE